MTKRVEGDMRAACDAARSGAGTGIVPSETYKLELVDDSTRRSMMADVAAAAQCPVGHEQVSLTHETIGLYRRDKQVGRLECLGCRMNPEGFSTTFSYDRTK